MSVGGGITTLASRKRAMLPGMGLVSSGFNSTVTLGEAAERNSAGVGDAAVGNADEQLGRGQRAERCEREALVEEPAHGESARSRISQRRLDRVWAGAIEYEGGGCRDE